MSVGKRYVYNSWTVFCGLVAMAFMGCAQDVERGFVGSAVVEADSWKVGAQATGPLLAVGVREGDSVNVGDTLAVVDSMGLQLKLLELDAAMQELRAGVAARAAEVQVQVEKQKGAERELKRSAALQAEGALPARGREEWQTQVDVGMAAIQAGRLAVDAQRARLGTLLAQRESLRDQLRRCVVTSPVAGRVANRYRNAGEMVAPGKPVLELQRTDTMIVDVFVPQTDLSNYKLGQVLKVRLDSADGQRFVPGSVSWISSEAEFTPKSIQTRTARNELVFRMRLRVANRDGALKRGLPVEVWSAGE